MTEFTDSFAPAPGLERAVELLRSPLPKADALPVDLPELGAGEMQTLETLAPHVLEGAARLDRPEVLAHMNPPAPWITWAMALWNARLNQNLLHPDTGPFALEAEARVMHWLAPFYGMEGGHLCSGSTLANLTALWAARDAGGVRRIVASEAAHLSITKAARLLGLPLTLVPVDHQEQIDPDQLGDCSDACLVLTAGTTATGSIDSLGLIGQASWTHVDAAWAGPLRLSRRHAHLLDGIEHADSIAVSAHKWFFQPKESAMILFKDLDRSNAAISFGSNYLSKLNIGVQGSRGATAVPLLATLLAWGRTGLAERLDHAMALAGHLAEGVKRNDQLRLWEQPKTGITIFRPETGDVEGFHASLPDGMLSKCEVRGQRWLRSVAANPLADVDAILRRLKQACRRAESKTAA